MTDTTTEPVTPPSSHRRRWSWAALGGVALLIAGGVITAVDVSFHYLHAPGLQVGGSFGWFPPDNLATRSVQAGPYNGLVVAPRPGHTQSFYVDVYNPSSVTQTVLGPAYDTSHNIEPDHLAMSTTSTLASGPDVAHYTTRPVAIPPHGYFSLRLSHDTGGCRIWGHGARRSEFYTELSLRVKVGAFTRTERLDFGDQVFELRGPARTC